MGYELQSLDRALRVVSLIADGRGMRLTDIADGLGTNQTTAIRTLRVLEQHGYVRRTSRNEYRLGTRLVELGAAVVDSLDLTNVLRPLIADLSREFEVTAHVGLLRDGMITVVSKVDSQDSPVRYSALGTRMPLNATAGGKAALALMPPAGLAALGLADPLPAYTINSIVRTDHLRDEIRATLARGYSIEREEYNLGFCCVGTALQFGDDLFTVSLSGTLVAEDELDRRGRTLRESVDLLLRDYHGAVRGLGSEREPVAVDTAEV